MSYPDYQELERYEREGKPETTSVAELARNFKDAGVEGRHVMVHSSYRSIRPVENGPQGVVDAIVEAVGEKGCVLFPTYDFKSFTELGYWDRQLTTSKMGIISETARKDDGRFDRSPHPILSYAVWGDDITDANPDIVSAFRLGFIRYGYLDDVPNAHGAGSVFDKFINNNGLLLSIGALSEKNPGFSKEDRGFTIVNHAKCLAGVDCRFTKCFTGTYVDGSRSTIRTYSASVHAEGVKTAVSAAHEAAEKEGVIRKVRIGHSETHVAEAREFHEWCMKAVVERPELFYICECGIRGCKVCSEYRAV